MTTNIIINNKKHTIEINQAFEKAASIYGSNEYKDLRQARIDNPYYRVVVVKRKASAASFRGLNFKYMEKYISSHDVDGSIMETYLMLRGQSDEARAMSANSENYLKIKKWFLDTYPEIKEFHERRESILKAS